ncbi:MAG: ABC transporter ATP-binding protein, partial [Bacteroidota bacterium]
MLWQGNLESMGNRLMSLAKELHPVDDEYWKTAMLLRAEIESHFQNENRLLLSDENARVERNQLCLRALETFQEIVRNTSFDPPVVTEEIAQLSQKVKGYVKIGGSENAELFFRYAKRYALSTETLLNATYWAFQVASFPKLTEQRKDIVRRNCHEIISTIHKELDDWVEKLHSEVYAIRPISMATVNPNPFLKCVKLSKHYKKFGFELRDVSVSLERGEILGLVGANGSGKTTFLEMVAGNLRPDSGDIYFPDFFDEKVRLADWKLLKSRIAYVPQDLPKLYGSLVDTIQFFAAKRGVLGAQNVREVDFIIHRLGLEKHIRKTWKQLSGGFKLRFALAAALVWKPALLILDEPLANLDPRAKRTITQDLRSLT